MTAGITSRLAYKGVYPRNANPIATHFQKRRMVVSLTRRTQLATVDARVSTIALNGLTCAPACRLTLPLIAHEVSVIRLIVVSFCLGEPEFYLAFPLARCVI
jgi:hypothetical protein